MPRPIGWGTTISAPSVHACTLQTLKDRMKPGARALDIGTGSGYVAACFAEMVGKEGKVIAFEPNPKTFESLKFYSTDQQLQH